MFLVMKKYKNLFIFFVLVGLTFAGSLPFIAQAAAPYTYSGATGGLDWWRAFGKNIGWMITNPGQAAKNVLADMAQSFLTLLSSIFIPILQGIVILFTHLITFALNINSQLFNGDFIIKSWATVRDVTNLGFILVIIVIAFATILRIEDYGVKKTLAKLIIIALLVNFSLMICAAIFDLANIVTTTFLKGLTNDQIASKLQSVLGFNQLDAGQLELLALTIPFAGFIFMIIFLAIIILTFAVLFVMLLIRYAYLGILVILAPLAWLCFILPLTAQWTKKWWSQFLRWIIFAPAMTFFIYLAFSAHDNATFQNLIGASSNTAVSAGTATGSIIGNLFIMTGILLGGLIIANSLSLAGARAVIAGATAVGAGVGLFAARGLSRFVANRDITARVGQWAHQQAVGGSRIGRGIISTTRRISDFGYGHRPIKPKPPQRGVAMEPTGLIEILIDRMKFFRGKEGKKFIPPFGGGKK